MNKKTLLIVIVLLTVTLVAGAATLFMWPYDPQTPPRANDEGSTLEGINALTQANNQFAFEMYLELNKDLNTPNLFISPYSISSALAMTYEGAKGQTADEMKNVLHLPDKEILRPNFAAIYNNINSGSEHYKLSTGNALWAQNNYPFLEEFMLTAENFYGGKAANLDFKEESEKSRQTINSFIEAQSNGRIKEIVKEGQINPQTRLVLSSAIYFKGNWEWEFDKSKSNIEDFKITPQEVIQTKMMEMHPNKVSFNYADLDNLQMIELPYKGDELSMIILLPNDNIESIEQDLTIETFESYKELMKPSALNLIKMPAFKFESDYTLNGNLVNMGMPTAFSSTQADFTGMYDRDIANENLYIGLVLHKTFIEVNEQGTEAAAATVVNMQAKAMYNPDGPRDYFVADHPFIFVIQEVETGNILFMGKIVDPR